MNRICTITMMTLTLLAGLAFWQARTDVAAAGAAPVAPAPPSALAESCGTDGFGAATNFGAGVAPTSVVVGDFNLDGKPDLATTNVNSSNVSVLLGNGSGSFGAATTFAANSSPISVAVGDFNGDGKPDLAVANELPAGAVTILTGDGSGSFTASAFTTASNSPTSVAVGDFNGDGKPDLVTANFNADSVSVWLGNGSGGFSAATDFATASTPIYVAAGDFNGDGKPDLATANFSSNNVSVLLGNGSGGFGAATNFAAAFFPFSVAVGDFNADGKPDLAAANRFSNNVSVLLNNSCYNSAPVAQCQSVTVTAGASCTANASINNGSYDPDSGDTITVTQTPAGPYPLGTTAVTLTVTDSHGASSSCQSTVTVVDNTKPVINCPANVIVYLPPGSMDTGMFVNYPAPTAMDNCSTTPTITTSPASGSIFPVGVTTVQVTARDASGNQSSCSLTVTVRYNFSGFFQPVDNAPTVNVVTAGSSVPVKFSLSGSKGLNIFAAGFPQSAQIACGGGASDDIEETVTAGASSLSYDTSLDQYRYVWKTDRAWKGTCRKLVLKFIDGTSREALFQFK